MNGRSRGFTLMEMLVTLVIFALVSGLLWQALATVAHMEDGLWSWTQGNRDQALREEWVREILRGLAPGTQTNPVKFEGDQASLHGYTTMPPWPRLTGPLLIQLRLHFEKGETHLIATAGDLTGDGLLLYSWSGSGHFEYLDLDGDHHDAWPPPLHEVAPLPAAIRLVGPPDGGLLVAVQASNNPMLRRVDVGPL